MYYCDLWCQRAAPVIHSNAHAHEYCINAKFMFVPFLIEMFRNLFDFDAAYYSAVSSVGKLFCKMFQQQKICIAHGPFIAKWKMWARTGGRWMKDCLKCRSHSHTRCDNIKSINKFHDMLTACLLWYWSDLLLSYYWQYIYIYLYE